MTVQNKVNNSVTQVADGFNRTWTYPFKLLRNTDVYLAVTRTDGSTYAVSVPDIQVNNLENPTGGTIVYPISPAAPLPAGYLLVAQRKAPMLQPYRMGTQGNYSPKTVEDALDTIVMAVQDAMEGLERAVVAPETDQEGQVVLPSKAVRANKLLQFDADGKPSVTSTGIEEIILWKQEIDQTLLDVTDLKNQTVDLWTDFQHFWLGPRDTPPTENDDGTPLITGAEYFDTVNGLRYTWNGTAWAAAGAASLAPNSVQNTHLVDMAATTVKGNAAGAPADPTDIDMPTLRTMIGAFVGAGAGARSGLVPSPGPGSGNVRFLREDGNWGLVPSSLSSCYLRILNGAQIILEQDGGEFLGADGTIKRIPDTGVIGNVAGLTVGASYYVFAADQNGDGVIDTLQAIWTGGSSYAIDPDTYLPVLATDHKWTLVGGVTIASGPSFVDDQFRRLVASYFNPRPKKMFVADGTDISITTTSVVNMASPAQLQWFHFKGGVADFSYAISVDPPDNGSATSTATIWWSLDGTPQTLGDTGWAQQMRDTSPGTELYNMADRFVIDPATDGYHSVGVAWQGGVAGHTLRRTQFSQSGVIWS